MKHISKLIGLGVATVVMASGGLATGVASADGLDGSGFCVPLSVPAPLGEGKPFNQHLAVTYCQPRTWAKGQHQVDVLTAGATYTGNYWNWPQNPSLYSYVQKTLKAGRATVSYDRLGSGKSSHPLSTDITIEGEAYRLHLIIQAAKLLGYKQVNNVGHSYGSAIAMREASTYKDANRVVLTGYLHTPRNPVVAAGNYPANLDPLFVGQKLDSGQPLDDGYLTSKPATTSTPSARQTNFYSSSADPAVIAYDDAHKDLVTATGFVGFFADRGVPAGANLSNQITAPVLLVDGQQDFIFCFDPAFLDCSSQSGVQAHEAPYFTGAANLTVRMIPDTGHDLTLHPSANDSFKQINEWINSH